jgi:hypothetical protein
MLFGIDAAIRYSQYLDSLFSQYYHNNHHITDSHYASQYHSQLVLIVGALVQCVHASQKENHGPMELLLREGEEES